MTYYPYSNKGPQVSREGVIGLGGGLGVGGRNEVSVPILKTGLTNNDVAHFVGSQINSLSSKLKSVTLTSARAPIKNAINALKTLFKPEAEKKDK